MESNNNKNNNNNDGGDKHEQLRGNAQNRKSNKSANDEDKPAATGEDQNCSSTKNLEEESGVSETPTITTMDLTPSSHVPLPLELHCEIFKCLKLPIQKKFIWGLGRDIYGIFGQKLLKKTKRVHNPIGNRWNGTTMTATIAANGLNVSNNTNRFSNVFSVQPFLISGPHCRADDFPGTILYYYEVKGDLHRCLVGLSGGAIPDNDGLVDIQIPYAIPITGQLWYACRLAGERHLFEFPEGPIPAEMKPNGNVFGCGLLLDPQDKLAIFFTFNGKLWGRKIPISPTVDRLFPSVTMRSTSYVLLEANFGDDPAKPFEYNIQTCPGLELACI